MKNYFFGNMLCVVIIFFFSCEPQSIVKFKDPQPVGSENLNSFPSRFTGHYVNDETSLAMIISAQQIVSRHEADLAEHKDSLQNYFDIAYDSILDKETSARYHFTINGDTAYWHHTLPFDTIFSIEKGGVLRKLRGHYFLNMPVDSGYWNVRKIDLVKGKLVVADIIDSADIANLQEITQTANDSTYVFKPTRKQFKKYVKNDGFAAERILYKIK